MVSEWAGLWESALGWDLLSVENFWPTQLAAGQPGNNYFCQNRLQATAPSPGCEPPSPNSIWPSATISYVVNNRFSWLQCSSLPPASWWEVKHRTGILHQALKEVCHICPEAAAWYCPGWCSFSGLIAKPSSSFLVTCPRISSHILPEPRKGATQNCDSFHPYLR